MLSCSHSVILRYFVEAFIFIKILELVCKKTPTKQQQQQQKNSTIPNRNNKNLAEDIGTNGNTKSKKR